MPNHVYFKEKFGVGQRALFCVLKGVSLVEKETGYVQGMNYLAGMLLTYMDMEDAFSCMLCILRDYNMRDFFLPGMPGLAKAFYIHLSLLKKYHAKLLKHFRSLNFVPQTYGSQWFMTLFACTLPYAAIVRIWDIFMVEGRKILYRVSLAIFSMLEKELMKCEIEGVFEALNNLQKDIDPEELIKKSLSYTFSNSYVDKLEKEFLDNPDKDIAKICQME